MALYVVAIHTRYNCYHTFRIVDTQTGQVKDILSEEVYMHMGNGLRPLKIEHIKLHPEKDTFKFIGCDESRICRLDRDMNPTVNENGMVITGIQGDYCFIANYKGQILKAHMLQIKNSVDKRKAVLVNADILDNGRIVIRPH